MDSTSVSPCDDQGVGITFDRIHFSSARALLHDRLFGAMILISFHKVIEKGSGQSSGPEAIYIYSSTIIRS